jgi:hypothetical protein
VLAELSEKGLSGGQFDSLSTSPPMHWNWTALWDESLELK